MLHQVNKLQIEVMTLTEAEAFEVRHYFSRYCQEQIMEAIEKVSANYVSDDEWIEIDRLEIDLGRYDMDKLRMEFPDHFISAFDEVLARKIKELPVDSSSKARHDSFIQPILYYLQTGTAPWWFEKAGIDMNVAFDKALQEHPQSLQVLLSQLQYNHYAWQRIALQFSAVSHSLIISMFPSLQFITEKLQRILERFNNGDTSLFQKTINEKIHINTIEGFVLFHASSLLQDRNGRTMIDLLKSYDANTWNDKNIFISMANSLEEMITSSSDGREATLYPSVETSILDEITPPEKFNIQTSGLILLAPYFGKFFNKLQFLVDGAWKDVDSQHKAIHLLSFLATGVLKSPETNLVFEKVLCGMDISFPIPKEVQLSRDEISEAEDLLMSVIANWPSLKNTSINGLRGAFLKRDGILSKKESNWILQVERKTHDIILDRIPWGFSMVRLTWNNYNVITEW